MVEINLWSGLKRLTGGVDKVDVEGTTIGEVLEDLVAKHPELDPVIKAGVSVALDGRMIANARNEPVTPESEVYLLQRLKGG